MSRIEIMAANPIADFVRGRGHNLKRAGENFVTAGCPIAEHKKAGHRPVTLDTRKNVWRCNDCGKGGSVIDWVMQERGCTFAEATDLLAAIKSERASENTDSADDEAIARLAALPLLEYERVRKVQAKELGIRAPLLDKLVAALRPQDASGLQGAPVTLADVEPWPERVDGAVVLDGVAGRIGRYVVLPPGAADVSALWIAHTHCYRSFTCSPRMNATSPEKGSGKTTLRDVLAQFVPRPILTENITTAVLFRLVAGQSPTILADEYDAWLPDNEELRGLFNAGHRSGAMVYRCEGDNNEVRAFAAYAPAMLCGIGSLPGTLHDRSIVIRLARARAGEIQARFDIRHVEVETELCRKLARWISDNRVRIEECDPQLPESVFNRVADNWRPFFTIAEIAGGDWPERCATAYAKLQSGEFEDVETLRVMLLADIQQIFAGTWPLLDEGERPVPKDRMFSKDLCEQLATMTERPWPEICHGKAITERWLARNLAAFAIRSKTLRIYEERAKGYEVDAFVDAFDRYLKRSKPEGGVLSVTP